MNPLFVFVPGWVFDNSAWGPLKSELGHFETLCPTAQGLGSRQGSAADAQNWSLEGVLSDLANQLAPVQSRQPVLIGNSLGGTLALAAAARWRQPLAGVVSVDGSPRWLKSPDWAFGYEPESLPPLFESFRQRWTQAFDEVVRAVALREDPDQNTAEAARIAVGCASGVQDPAVPIAILQRVLTIDIREELPAIACPVLLIHGERDPISPPSLGQWMAEQIPDARLVSLPGAGHLPHLTRPAALARAIHEFLGLHVA